MGALDTSSGHPAGKTPSASDIADGESESLRALDELRAVQFISRALTGKLELDRVRDGVSPFRACRGIHLDVQVNVNIPLLAPAADLVAGDDARHRRSDLPDPLGR